MCAAVLSPGGDPGCRVPAGGLQTRPHSDGAGQAEARASQVGPHGAVSRLGPGHTLPSPGHPKPPQLAPSTTEATLISRASLSKNEAALKASSVLYS